MVRVFPLFTVTVPLLVAVPFTVSVLFTVTVPFTWNIAPAGMVRGLPTVQAPLVPMVRVLPLL